MKIKFISVETTDKVTKSNKPYVELDITFKNCDFQEKVESKKLNPFGNKSVYDTLKSAKTGDFFDVSRVKNDAGFWDWTDIKPIDGSNAPAASVASSGSKTVPTPKSTYETPEERALRQIYIVRQSSIGHAIETLKTDKKSPEPDDVLALASKYESFVFGQQLQQTTQELPPVDDLTDDIPY